VISQTSISFLRETNFDDPTMKVNVIKQSIVLTALVFVTQIWTVAVGNTIVFNNLAPTTPYYNNFGNSTGTAVGGYSTSATSFTPSASGPLDEVTLGMFNILGSTSVTLELSPDVAGLPSVPIWTNTTTAPLSYGSLLSVTGIGGPTLNGGQQYWVEAIAPVTPTALDAWYTNNQGDVGPIIANGNYVANTDRLALRVGVLAAKTPEPCSCLLMLSGVLGLTISRRRWR
jgi:hypothetical protein